MCNSLGDVRVRIAKFAPESNLLCLQRNDKEVEFLDLRPLRVSSDSDVESSDVKRSDSLVSGANGVSDEVSKPNGVSVDSSSDSGRKARPVFRFVQSCVTNAKVENRLLGFFWPSPTMLVLISKAMIEMFSFNPKLLPSELASAPSATSRSSSASSGGNSTPLTKVREVAMSVNWWSYSAASRVLLVSTEPSGSKLSPFYFSSPNMDLTPLSKFKIDLKGVERISKSDIYLRQLYGQIFCIYINSSANELVFYQLTLSATVLYLTITNLPNGPIKLSFVDNLVLTHSTSLKVTAVYDIRFRQKQSITVENPITPPLPIARPIDVGFASNTTIHVADYSGTDNISPRYNVTANGTGEQSTTTRASYSFSANSSPSKTLSTPIASPIPSPGEIQPKITLGEEIAVSVSNGVKESGSDALSPMTTSSSFISMSSTPKCSPHSAVASPLNGMQSKHPQYGHPATLDFSRSFVYDYVQFLVPEFAVNRLNGQIYRLSVNYDAFVAAFRDPVKLVSFLMRRERSKPILLKLIRKLIEQRYDLRIIVDILDRFTAALHSYTEEQKLAVSPSASSSASSNLSASASSSSSAAMSSSSQRNSSSSPSRSSVDSIQQSAARTSSPAKRASFDPWGSRRSDQYVAAFKKSKGGSSSNLSSSFSGSASASTASSSGDASSSSPGNGSPLVSPSSSLNSLPSPEELGLDVHHTTASSSSFEPQLRTRRGQVVISQQDMYTQVFLPLEEKGVPWKILECVIMSYITSLTQHYQLPVDSDIYGFIIDLLVRNKQYYQLHQLLQLRVISDTLHVACQLMHLSSTYPPATQLALDMFKRLREHAYTIESLLSSGMVLIALKFLKSTQWTLHEAQSLVPRFLQEAKNSGDSTLFYVTYMFFSQRNEIFTGTCDEHARHFAATFETVPTELPTI